MLGFPLLFLGWLVLMFNICLGNLYLKPCKCFGSGRTKGCVVLPGLLAQVVPGHLSDLQHGF